MTNIDDTIIEPDAEEGSEAVDKIRKLKIRLSACEEEKTINLFGWQRERADFVNYKRDVFAQIQTARETGARNAIEALMPVLESFEIALAHSPDDVGLNQVYSQMRQVLKAEGFEEVGVVGDEFDPSMHESVGIVNVAEKEKENIIHEIVSKGYKFLDRVIKPAKVKIGFRN